jgi:PAS domain S-box-containing protein
MGLPLHAVLRYAVAPVAIAAALGLANAFLYFHWGQPFATLAFCAIAITFWYSGVGPGLLASLLAAVIRIYLPDPGVTAAGRILFDFVFLFYAALMIQATWARHELEARVAQRTADLSRANENLKLEIAERTRAEEAVGRSEKELREVIETIPAMTWTAGPDGSSVLASKRWMEYTGLSVEDIEARGWQIAIHSEDLVRYAENWRVSRETGQPFEDEARFRRAANGEYRWFLMRAVPLRDEIGNILKWYGIATDIQDRRRADEALHAAMSERTRLAAFREEIAMALARGENLRAILHNCAEAMVDHLHAAFARIWTLSSDARELELQASAGMYSRLDGSHSRIPLGQFKIGLIAQEKKPHMTNDVQNDPRVSDKDWARREKMVAFAGHPLLVGDQVVGVMGMFSQQPLREGTLETLSFVADAIAQGIERKRAEEALRRSEAYLAESQRLTHTGSWAVNPALEKTVYWSEETFRIFGVDPREGGPTFETYRQRIHPEDRDRVRRYREHSFREKLEYVDDYRILLPDETLRHIHVIGHPVLDETGEVREYVGTVVDVTDRKRAEEERERLHQLEADLEHINRVTMMGELAASLAHEIKQPIAAATTNARTSLRWLQRQPPDLEQVRESVLRIVKDVSRASDIIDRNRSLFQRGTPQRELLDANEIIRQMVTLLRDAASRYSAVIRTELDTDLPAIAADRVQLQQVLMNLILNGIEAMQDTGGELTIKSQWTEDRQALVSVSDSGVGLPAGQTDRIFEAFFTTKPHGTGMGLSISRRIIESHGGHLWASPNTGPGATFYFTLPNDVAAFSASTAQSRPHSLA